MNIHHNIRAMRKAKGLTQEQLAEAMGVSSASVSKWENGQCVPELTALAALADYFEVSVDSLIGHELKTARLESMAEEAMSLADDQQASDAAALVEKILRNYPNSFDAAEKCIHIFYKLYMFTGHKPYMERCIQLTKRQFTLGRDESEAGRLERMTYLANQHELLPDWEMAKHYYEKSNVSGNNDRHIARCLLKLGKPEEALTAISDVVSEEMYQQFMDASVLSEVWEKLGQPELAAETLLWNIASMERLDYAPSIRLLTYVRVAGIYETAGNIDQAKEMIRRAARLASSVNMPDDVQTGAPFLKPGKPQKMLMSFRGSGKDFLTTVLSKASETLMQTAMEEMA